jgi:hypothetical protein
MKFKMLGGTSKLVSDQLLTLFPGHKQGPRFFLVLFM